MPSLVREQILAVRDTGRTNMFDIQAVKAIAYEMDMFELFCFLDNEDSRKEYCNFILYGDSKPTK